MSVVLHGSYFGYNFGDTLLCRLFCNWLKQAGADIEVAVPLANARNKSLIGADARGLASLHSARRLVFCGGGYLGEPKSGQLKWTLRAYKRHMLLARWAVGKIPVNVLGLGVGPLSSRHMQRDVVALFEAADKPVVRDEVSAQYLHTWGVRSSVEVKVDAVVTASKDELLQDTTCLPGVEEAKKRHGKVVAVHLDVRPDEHDGRLMRGVIEWILTETPYAVMLVDDGHLNFDRRTWASRYNVDDQHRHRFSKVLYSGTPSDLIGIVNAVDLVVTTKLHVGIVRCALHKPVISLPRHSKTPRFYEQMGLEDWCVADQERDRFGAGVDLVKSWMDGKRPNFSVFETKRCESFYRQRIKDTVLGSVKS